MKQLNFPACISMSLVLFACLLYSSCSSDDGGSFSLTSDISITNVFDVGNAQSAGDIYYSLGAQNSISNSQVRLVIIANGTASDLTLDQLNGLSATAYTALNWNGTVLTGQLNANQTTIMGTPLANNTAYQLVAYFVDAALVSVPSTAITLTDAGPFDGEYTGLWNDNIYTDFPVSTTIEQSGNRYRGSFYYSGNFAPCCGGDDDGFIDFEIDGSQINFFRYSQNLPNYMGGCPGAYEGAGRVISPVIIEIDFTGDDCDGTHTGGLMRLNRIK